MESVQRVERALAQYGIEPGRLWLGITGTNVMTDPRQAQVVLDGCNGGQAIARAAVAPGHDLGLSVTAEGVEDAACLKTLSELGCDAAQGFGVARPMAADAALAWVQEHVVVAAA